MIEALADEFPASNAAAYFCDWDEYEEFTIGATEAPDVDVQSLSKWLHHRRFGCVSSFGTDAVARAAYDEAAHREDAAGYARSRK
jgi:hypothetical protein